jgi:hypothetical protein
VVHATANPTRANRARKRILVVDLDVVVVTDNRGYSKRVAPLLIRHSYIISRGRIKAATHLYMSLATHAVVEWRSLPIRTIDASKRLDTCNIVFSYGKFLVFVH